MIVGPWCPRRFFPWQALFDYDETTELVIGENALPCRGLAHDENEVEDVGGDCAVLVQDETVGPIGLLAPA